ncbi:MAG: hypothetical protein A2Y58_01115 [Chloroflexi bacterium RBG_13_51_52]|nr:MAG: hypothetical protein A2Y58_01115 [Chloroflexi bacterium RBG_13_51_52]
MSRLIDNLTKLSQAAPPPMGFHTSRQAETSPTMLIIGRTAIKSAAPAAKASSGADAVLIYADKSEPAIEDIKKTVKPLGDIPWGVYLEESGKATAALIEGGCDFVVFSPTSRIPDLPQDEKVGKILQVESSMDDGLLRAVNDLPADAVLVTDALEGKGTITMHQLMIYRHLAAFISKPIIVPVAANITEAELKALQDAEIDGVMADMDIAKGEDLKKLRKTIGKLPPRSAKKRDKRGVLLPRAGGESQTIEPPDEEEEEDE